MAGRTAGHDAAGRRRVSKAERHRLIRQLIGEGVDAGAIRSRLQTGIKLQDGREVKLSPRAAQEDVREVSQDFGRLLTDEDLLRIEVTAAVTRIKRNGMKAAAGDVRTGPDGKLEVVAKPDRAPAIHADRTIVELAGRFRPDLYGPATGRKAVPPTPTALERDTEEDLSEVPLEDLLSEARRGASRLHALGLVPLETDDPNGEE